MPRQPKLPPGMTKRGTVYFSAFRAGGRLVRKRLSTDLSAAKEMLNDLKARADRADFGLVDNDVSLTDLRKGFERHCRLTVGEATCLRYKQSLDKILGGIPAKKVSQLTDAVVNTFREARRADVSSSTVNKDVKTLTAMLAWAVGADLIGSNPLQRMKPLPTKGKEVKQRRALTAAEAQSILAEASPYVRPAFRMLLTTGMRKGEVASLKFTDIDFDRAVVMIRTENSKTKRSREIPLDEEMLATIRRLRDDAPFRRPGKGNTPKDTARVEAAFTKEHVFVTQANTPWGHRLLRRFYATCKRLGIEDACPGGSVDIHACRGTFTTLAIDGGANPKDVQTILGHSTLEMTMNAYAKSTAHARRAAISALPYAKAAQPESSIPMRNVPSLCASSKSSTQIVAG